MAELKTQKTNASVAKFINAIDEDQRRKDCAAIAAMMQKAAKSKPRMWGTSIVGFGDFASVDKAKEQHYIKTLDDVHLPTLRSLIALSIKRVKSRRIDYSK